MSLSRALDGCAVTPENILLCRPRPLDVGALRVRLHVVKPTPKLVLYVPSDRYSRERDLFAREVLENECPMFDVLGALILGADARLRWPERKQ